MSARDWALIELDRLAIANWKPGLLKRRVSEPTDARDLALAENIRLSVVKNLLLLQHLIVHHSGKPLTAVDPVAQKILAVGLCQLRFLDRIPPSAAVDQAVEQTRRFGRARLSGFVNAVLRNATRNPDPSDLPDWLALSHPQPLFDRLVGLLGRDDAMRLCRKHNSIPPTIVRAIAGSIDAIPHRTTGMFVVTGARQSELAAWARQGIAQVQDPTSAEVVDHCDVQPEQLVLDRCCGSGTKTLQLSERTGPGGRVVAIDPDPSRCGRLREVLAARRIDNVAVVQGRSLADVPAPLPRQFDRVLIDAPCSNSGVLIRRAEARYRQDATTLASLSRLQQQILDDTVPAVASGGLLIYSTCSIWDEENHQQTSQFCTRHPQFRCVSEKTTLPSLDPDPTTHHDGGYVAVLSRS